jgi:lactoylglutathione lyase
MTLTRSDTFSSDSQPCIGMLLETSKRMNNDNLLADLSFRIHHTMLPVADLDRSIDFYTRLLGMKVMARRTDELRKLNVGHVGYGERETQPSIELHQRLGDDASVSGMAGKGHIAIHVNDLQKLCTVLENAGIDFMQPPKRGTSGNFTAWIRDPDGHALELAERRPSPVVN